MNYPHLEVCPFCAHTAELTDSVATRAFTGTEAYGYTVLCNAAKGGCGATCGYWETEAEAAMRWNMRARAPAVRETETEIEARWRHDRFLALKKELELDDSDEATVMTVAKIRIARLTALEELFKSRLSDPAGVHGALPSLAQAELSEAQVSLVLTAVQQQVRSRRRDVLRVEEPPGETSTPAPT